ncbi:hypothetical protein SAMN02745194_03778 [Roseomonas rosea]|uniref:Uncharacterized protein n=1 Tax=Muricoccus roseus TaxID=198092 RepID=A0A1M6NFB4_9PROT|nr:hypothetical protein [Roseomonas rosea]SHJ94380.1 hypothetical protein SAMN02745194_03778 [Roseomonas rosea]
MRAASGPSPTGSATPPERAARNLAARRRARRATWPLIARAVLAQREAIEAACARLRGLAAVEAHDFDAALTRARDLLGLQAPGSPAASQPDRLQPA